MNEISERILKDKLQELEQARRREEMRAFQRGIAQWGERTFGRAEKPVVLIGRALEEFGELFRCLGLKEDGCWLLDIASDTVVDAPEFDHDLTEVADEMSDVVVVLLQAAERYGFCLMEEVERKMEINYGRKWRSNGDGTGQHV